MENKTLEQIVKRLDNRQARLARIQEQCEANLEAIQALARMVNGMNAELSWVEFDREDDKNRTLMLFEKGVYDTDIHTAMSALAYRAQHSLEELVKIAEEPEQEGEP